MYVVMTTAELFQYAGFFTGIDGTENTAVRDTFGWDYQALKTEYTGISQSELDAFEICVPEHRARRLRILAPRGEFWISQAVGSRPKGGERPLKPVPEALAPARGLPEKGKPVQPQLVPGPIDPYAWSRSPIEHCMICWRHVRELEAFGGSGDPLLGDFKCSRKLIKGRRELEPGYTESTWECRDCAARDGPLWAIDEEDRLGRPLTEREYGRLFIERIRQP